MIKHILEFVPSHRTRRCAPTAKVIIPLVKVNVVVAGVAALTHLAMNG